MLENITIEKYKCFENFKLEGLSKINIISGKNDVGKTALLEALYINNHSYCDILSVIAQNRDIKKIKFHAFLKKLNYSITFNRDNKFTFIVKKKLYLNSMEKNILKEFNADYDEFVCEYHNNELHMTPLEKINMIEDNEYRYINSTKPTNHKLVKMYSKIQTLGIQDKVLKYLKLLDDNIIFIEPQFIDDELVLRINLENPKLTLTTSELGEGVNRYIEIIISMLSIDDDWANNYSKGIYIDEIENGLHYSKLFDIAKAIIQISQKEDIQVFITTHDKDTIEAFAQASEELEFNDISSIELYKDHNNEISSIIRNSKQFLATVDTGIELR